MRRPSTWILLGRTRVTTTSRSLEPISRPTPEPKASSFRKSLAMARSRGMVWLGLRSCDDVLLSADLNATAEPGVEWGGQPESVILTRRRGDAEIGAEKQRERKNERGDSGRMSPSVDRKSTRL